MTTLTSATDRITPALSPDASASFLTTTPQTARRTLLQFALTPQLLVMPPVLAGLFLLIFRYIFGGAIDTGGSVHYVDFLVPGFLAQTVLWHGMNVPAGVAEDSSSGVYDRLRSLPIPRAAVMAGRALADTALNVWGLAVTALLGFAVGFRTHADLAAVIVAFAVILAVIYAFSWLFISLRSEEHTSELQSRPQLVCRLLLEKHKATEAGVVPDTAAPTMRSSKSVSTTH